jgi:hypothetical protein
LRASERSSRASGPKQDSSCGAPGSFDPAVHESGRWGAERQCAQTPCLQCSVPLHAGAAPGFGSETKDGSDGTSGEGADASKGTGTRRSWCTPPEQVKPIACFIRPDFAPRDAVRMAGPRFGLTRSAHGNEPGGTAIRPGDGSRGPHVALSSGSPADDGDWEKNSGSNALTSAAFDFACGSDVEASSFVGGLPVVAACTRRC